MSYAGRAKLTFLGTIVVAVGLLAVKASTQADVKPTNDAPNPYQSIENYFKLPEGRTWGSTSAIDIDKDGRSIWVGERCQQNGCLDRATGQMSNLPTVLKFDPSGKLVKSFGEGMLIFAHGIFVDRDGNVWVTDGQDNAPQAARGTGAAPAVERPAARQRAGRRAADVWGPRRARRRDIRFSSSAPRASCC